MPIPFRRRTKCIHRYFWRSFCCHQGWAENLRSGRFGKSAYKIFLRGLWHPHLCQKPTKTRHVGFEDRHLRRSLLVPSNGCHLLHWSRAFSRHTSRCCELWENAATQVAWYDQGKCILEKNLCPNLHASAGIREPNTNQRFVLSKRQRATWQMKWQTSNALKIKYRKT